MINQGTNLKLNESDLLILEHFISLLDVQKEKLNAEVLKINSKEKFNLINKFFKLQSQPSTEIINFFSSYSSKLTKLIQSKLLTSREKLILVFIEEGLRSLIQFDVPETKIVFNVLKAVLARLSPLTESDLQYFETDKQIGSHIKDILNMKKTLKDENDAALEIVTTNKQILSSMIEQSDKENKLINKFISSLKKLSEPHEVDFQKSKSAIDKITKNLMNLLASHSEKASKIVALKTDLKELEETYMSATKVTRQANQIKLSWEQYAEYYNFRKYGSANAVNHAHDYLYYLRGRQKTESIENWLEHVGVGFETYYCLNPSSDDVLSFADVKTENEIYKALNAFNDVYQPPSRLKMFRFDDSSYFNQVKNISFLANKFYSKQREKKEIALERMIRQVENGKATEKVKANLASLIAKISLIDKAPHTITADVYKTEIDTDARKKILENLNETYLQLYNLTTEYLYISLQAMDEFFRLGLLKELNGFKKVLENKIQEEFNERKKQSVKKEKNAEQALKIVTFSVSRSFSQDGDYYISQSSPDFEVREYISKQLNILADEMDLLINFKPMVSTKDKLTANDLKPFDGKELETIKTLLDFSNDTFKKMTVNIKNNEKTREDLQKHRLKNDKAKQCLELISELQQMAAENDMLALLTNKNFYNVITEIYCQVSELSRYKLIEMLMHLRPEPNVFVAFYNTLKDLNQALAKNVPYEILGNSSIEKDSNAISQNLFFALLLAFHANSDFVFKVHLLKSALKVPFSSVTGTELTEYEIECFEVLFTASHRNPSLKETITNAFNYAKTIKNNDIQKKLQAFWGSVIPNQTYEIETILKYLKTHILPNNLLIEKSGILHPMPSAPSLEEIPEETYYQPRSAFIL